MYPLKCYRLTRTKCFKAKFGLFCAGVWQMLPHKNEMFSTSFKVFFWANRRWHTMCKYLYRLCSLSTHQVTICRWLGCDSLHGRPILPQPVWNKTLFNNWIGIEAITFDTLFEGSLYAVLATHIKLVMLHRFIKNI